MPLDALFDANIGLNHAVQLRKEEEDRGKASLTEMFKEVHNQDTPVVVERIANDIDEIVRLVRFSDWQNTSEGTREVRKALRRDPVRRLIADDVGVGKTIEARLIAREMLDRGEARLPVDLLGVYVLMPVPQGIG